MISLWQKGAEERYQSHPSAHCSIPRKSLGEHSSPYGAGLVGCSHPLHCHPPARCPLIILCCILCVSPQMSECIINHLLSLTVHSDASPTLYWTHYIWLFWRRKSIDKKWAVSFLQVLISSESSSRTSQLLLMSNLAIICKIIQQQ